MKSYHGQSDINWYELSLADHISATLAYWDYNLVCRFANASYLDWCGRTRQEMVDKMTIRDLFDPISERNETCIYGALNGIPQTFECEIILPCGIVKYAIASYSPDIQDGEVNGFYAHVTDVTQMKLLEKELIEANTLVNQHNSRLLNFANVVSHNLNSYAFNLSSVIEFMADAHTEEDKEELLRYLKCISKGFSSTVKNLSEIVHSQNLCSLKYEWINLHQYVDNTANILVNQFNGSHCAIKNQIQADMEIYTNPAYMDSIILNLLTNAVKYHHPDRSPEIAISASASDAELTLKIEDNGLGIDLKRYRTELFGMYKTFHGNADAQGIGLFITKFQVESMGGHIGVESQVDKGTTFTIHLPMHTPGNGKPLYQ